MLPKLKSNLMPMVYVNFPSSYTDEEEMLLKTYAKLRKKKKQIAQLKAKKPAPTTATTAAGKKTWTFPSEVPDDPKEAAKQLIKSGAIQAIKGGHKESRGFKRSRTLERRLTDTGEKTDTKPVGFQPFSVVAASKSGEENIDSSRGGGGGGGVGGGGGGRPPAKVKKLYESFVRGPDEPSESRDGGDRTSGERTPRRDFDYEREPRRGNTIYVRGYNVTEEMLRKTFVNFGPILNVSMEAEKNCGFVTFQTNQAAEQCINEMNGSMVQGVTLKVSLARRQPVIDLPAADVTTSSWSAIVYVTIYATIYVTIYVTIYTTIYATIYVMIYATIYVTIYVMTYVTIYAMIYVVVTSVDGGDRTSGERTPRRDFDYEREPRRGNTIYVRGYNVTEEMLRKTFVNFGPILNVSMEAEKNCGFVTFQTNQAAEQCINEMNGSMVQGVTLKVSLARRQPVIDLPAADVTTSSWSAIATNASQKGTFKDSRQLRTYDHDDIF
ncbi:PREDICTED: negative elongation factor E-like [Priapulus caudatus]|uniref:Negative elongation factor E n=1 Tax=Priapulus caudatus TaxID=37621 RepID=A0ABM1EYF7_PRICU|nr:PREDICTED: negative elongation factor E-like [Priapulus caudatus]